MLILYITLSLLFIDHQANALTATAILYQHGTNMSCGTLTFIQTNANTSVNVTGILTGLNMSSSHGFHVHTNSVSQTMPNCTRAGGHFNPYNTTHGSPTFNITNRHVGDLGNITSNANGSVVVNMTDSIIQLYNITQSIISRTIIVHLNRDDGGVGGFNDSYSTGNSGARILCGLIRLLSDQVNATTAFMNSTSTSMTLSTTSSAIKLNIQSTSFITVILSYLFFY